MGKKGFNVWSNLSRELTHHESCAAQKNAEVNHMTWIFGKTINSQLKVQRNAAVEMHRRAAATEIKAIRWLASEMVALRGHTNYDGKLLSLYTLLADFDTAAKSYLDRLENIRVKGVRSKRVSKVNILSPRNVRRLLMIMQKKTVERKVARMKVF